MPISARARRLERQIENWTYARATPLAKTVGVDGYYVRIGPMIWSTI